MTNPTADATHDRRRRAPRTRLVAAAVVAALMALALAGCLSEGQSAVHQELNADRQANGRAALPAHDTLNAKAQAWAEKMARDGRLSHADLRSGAPGCYRGLAENVGTGPSAAAVQDGFMRSSGHRSHILGSWTDVGVGHAVGGGRVWVVQVFMVRC